VPLRLAFYTPPDAAANVSCTPLGMANEWHLIALEGRTDEHGLTQLEIESPIEIQSPSMGAEGPSARSFFRGGGVEAVQAALVMETDASDAFCSIATELDRVPHKMLQKYSQQQAVLPVLFTAGTTYTMTTRCINQRQEPVRDTAVRLLLYSEKPMHASPVQGSSLHAMPKTALDGFVSRATAEPIVYGHAGIPDDCKRQVSAADKKADVQQDPTVLHAVIEELEKQRDSIASFARAELAGEIDPQLEALRLTNRELRAKVDDLALELKQAKTIAAQGERRAASSADHLLAVAAAAPPPPPTAPPPDVIAELQRKLEDEKRQNEQLRGSLTKSNEQLRAAVTQVAEVKEATHSHLQMGAAVHPGALGAIDPSMDPSRLKVSELKAILRERKVACEGAVEKQDLLDLVMQSSFVPGTASKAGDEASLVALLPLEQAMPALEQAMSNELQLMPLMSELMSDELQLMSELAASKRQVEHLELEWRIANGAARDASAEIAKLKDEIAKLKDKLRLQAGASAASSDEIAKLKDEIAKLRIERLRNQLSGAQSSGAPPTERQEENPRSKACVLS